MPILHLLQFCHLSFLHRHFLEHLLLFLFQLFGELKVLLCSKNQFSLAHVVAEILRFQTFQILMILHC